MRLKYLSLLLAIAIVLFSCKKEKTTTTPPPGNPVLLKDIVIPNLPSPYYHFEYNAAGSIIKASFASGLRLYDVAYSGGKISELKNNTLANKDRLQYIYNEAGKPDLIKYIDEAGTIFRIATLTYANGQLRTIEWERKTAIGFIRERTMAFIYQAGGNLLEITDHLHPLAGQNEATYVSRFEQYDNKINTDGFMLIHEHNDHLLLLPGLPLQKNNPRKLIRSGDGVNYTIDYTYTYNDKNTPLTKTGDAVFTSGPNAGQRWQTNAAYSYY
jgi:hypothetical protein